ncbi:methyltransferase [Micromonospora wenchangensis]|uniref:methyltransferase n=1 Tax=Micromonospora wenchangensis TaxID=1185415 RepID=UPI0033C2126E
MNADHRWTAVPGDFFDEVPAGGDVYALQYILHDWDDDRCVRILGDCRRAMNTRTAGVVGTGRRSARR